MRDEIRAQAERLAEEAGLSIEFIRTYKSFRKERRIKEILAERGGAPGLVHVFSAMEGCTSFRSWTDKKTGHTRLKPVQGTCLHCYFYFIDEAFGLMCLRVPTRAPFRLQVYLNGHHWLARRLGEAGIDHCRSSKPHRPQKSWHFSPLPTTVCYMKTIVMILVAFVHEIVLSRATLQLENVALRQQVAVLKRERPRPRLHPLDRVFWVLLFHLWPRWKDALVIVKPETVIGWHRRGFRLFWKWKSCHGKPGRPRTSKEIRELIQRMSRENRLWGAPRNHGELLKLGIDVSQATVTRYMVRHPKPPSQTWRTFLDNHVGSLVSIDFFVVPTARFAVLFVFIVLRHERRRIEHFGVTAHPSADWVAQQMREAFPWDTAPRYLIRDRDGAYGKSFRSTIMAMGAKEVVTAPRRPWQNPYVERLIGSVRRECLNHVIILNERHLRRVLVSYLDYYHRSRTHLSLGKDTPEGRPVQPGGSGKIVSFPQVGRLHHRYERLAA